MSEPNLDRWAREVAEQSKGSMWAGLGLTLVFHVLAQGLTLFIIAAVVTGEEGLILAFLPLMYIGLSAQRNMLGDFLLGGGMMGSANLGIEP